MRILFVVPYFETLGGPAQVVREVAQRLGQRGHQVDLFTTDVNIGSRLMAKPENPGQKFKVTYFKNLNNHFAWHKRAFLPPSFFRALTNKIADTDILHVIEYRHLLGIWAVNQAYKKGVSAIISPHAGIPNVMQRIRIKKVFDLLLGKTALKRFNLFHALTQKEKLDILAAGIPEDKILIISNGVEPLAPDDFAQKPAAREKLGIGKNETALLYMGRMHSHKGVNLLMESFYQAHSQAPNLKLLIAGPDDGELEPTMEFVRKNKLSDSVKYLGFISGKEKRDTLLAADIMVSLSLSEVMPISILEGLAFGCAVVASQAAKVKFLSQTGAGLIVPDNDSKQAAKIFVDLVGKPETISQMQRAAINLIAEKYSWDAVIDEYERAYQRLQSGKRSQ